MTVRELTLEKKGSDTPDHTHSAAGQLVETWELGDILLTRILDLLKENISNSEYKVENIGEELHMSRAQVFRKIGALTGNSPGDLLRVMRLKKAAELLLTGNLNIAQVMFEVGYQTPAYFARKFREYYGVNPSEYQRVNKA